MILFNVNATGIKNLLKSVNVLHPTRKCFIVKESQICVLYRSFYITLFSLLRRERNGLLDV